MSIILVCVFIHTYVYIYQISCVYSAKPPSENEERKFKKEKYYKRVRVIDFNLMHNLFFNLLMIIPTLQKEYNN